jgi:hypothetical protein
MHSGSVARHIEPKLRSYAFIERVACPSCRSSDWKTLHRQAFTDPPVSAFIKAHYGVDPTVLTEAPYELAECASCTLVFQRWIGSDQLLGELYGIWVHEHGLPSNEPRYQSELAHPLQSRDGHEIMIAAAYLGVPLTTLTTLDYGMGWALWARISRSLGCNSFGNDLAQSRMKFAEDHGVTPLTDAQLGSPRFHFINTEQVMEHLTAPREIADLLAASLLPGGILKVSVPSGDRSRSHAIALSEGRGGDFAGELMPIHPIEHVNTFTTKALERLAANLSLELVRPSFAQSYAFLARLGSVSPLRPAKAVKELVRPVYQWRNPANLYVWMRKPL